MADQQDTNTPQPLGNAYGPRGVTGSGSVSASSSTPAEFGEDGRPVEKKDDDTSEAGTDGQETQEGTAGGDQSQGGSPEGDTSGQEEGAGGDEPGEPEWTPLEAPSEDALKENLTKAGGFYAEPEYLPMALEFETSFAKTGTGVVSDAAIAKYAEAKGVAPDMVKAFIENANAGRQLAVMKERTATERQTAAQAKLTSDFHKELGGEAEYTKFLDWAKDGGLTKAQAAAFNKALDNDPETAKVLLGAFKEAFQAAGHGKPARDITNEGGAQPGVPKGDAPKGFTSKSEQDKAFADPRYHTDPAYRDEVARKAAASNF